MYIANKMTHWGTLWACRAAIFSRKRHRTTGYKLGIIAHTMWPVTCDNVTCDLYSSRGDSPPPRRPPPWSGPDSAVIYNPDGTLVSMVGFCCKPLTEDRQRRGEGRGYSSENAPGRCWSVKGWERRWHFQRRLVHPPAQWPALRPRWPTRRQNGN